MNIDTDKFLLIAGPCILESRQMSIVVAQTMKEICDRHGLEYVFKSSFEKANRTSINSFTGIGIDECAEIFYEIENTLNIPVLTDFHESWQLPHLKSCVSVAQIPAFLSRQTNLLLAARDNYKYINIKKSQMQASYSMYYCYEKCFKKDNSVWATERGSMYGMQDLVVDYRNFYTLSSKFNAVIMDVTHACQIPNSGSTTKGNNFQGLYARCAMATEHIDGIFAEVHPTPDKAKSDSSTQLCLDEIEYFIKDNIRPYLQLI